MYRINEFLTPAERLDAIRVGAMRKLASLGMTPSNFSREMEKQGEQTALSLGGAVRLAIAVGVPLGTISYALKSAIMPSKSQNKKLKSQLTEYNDIVDRYKRELGVDDEKKKAVV